MIIHTDGSYNPATEKAGWAFIAEDGEQCYDICSGYHELRNIAGELEAVLKAVTYAINQEEPAVDIVTDLQGAVKWFTGEWKTKHECTQVYYDTMKTLGTLIKIRMKHIRGHTDNELNKQVDLLAKRAVGVPEIVVTKRKGLSKRKETAVRAAIRDTLTVYKERLSDEIRSELGTKIIKNVIEVFK